MSSTTWTPPALSSEARPWRAEVWRMVDAQQIAATMKLVDGGAEQSLLETLLEAGKPATPAAAEGLHYLLATPFRYPPRAGGSRFRGTTDAGVFYGAESMRTAAAELGYWRWRFLTDAVDLERLAPVAHSAFCTAVRTTAIDLRVAPFVVDAASWTHPTDYAATQAFGRVARAAAIGAIVYQSVRDPEPAWCTAVLTPAAFAEPAPRGPAATWWLAVTQDEAIWRNAAQVFAFRTADWR